MNNSKNIEPEKKDKRKIENKLYNKELAKLQVELVKLQEWIVLKKIKGCCVIRRP